MGLGFKLIRKGLKKKENGKMESLSIEQIEYILINI